MDVIGLLKDATLVLPKGVLAQDVAGKTFVVPRRLEEGSSVANVIRAVVGAPSSCQSRVGSDVTSSASRPLSTEVPATFTASVASLKDTQKGIDTMARYEIGRFYGPDLRSAYDLSPRVVILILNGLVSLLQFEELFEAFADSESEGGASFFAQEAFAARADPRSPRPPTMRMLFEAWKEVFRAFKIVLRDVAAHPASPVPPREAQMFVDVIDKWTAFVGMLFANTISVPDLAGALSLAIAATSSLKRFVESNRVDATTLTVVKGMDERVETMYTRATQLVTGFRQGWNWNWNQAAATAGAT